MSWSKIQMPPCIHPSLSSHSHNLPETLQAIHCPHNNRIQRLRMKYNQVLWVCTKVISKQHIKHMNVAWGVTMSYYYTRALQGYYWGATLWEKLNWLDGLIRFPSWIDFFSPRLSPARTSFKAPSYIFPSLTDIFNFAFQVRRSSRRYSLLHYT